MFVPEWVDDSHHYNILFHYTVIIQWRLIINTNIVYYIIYQTRHMSTIIYSFNFWKLTFIFTKNTTDKIYPFWAWMTWNGQIWCHNGMAIVMHNGALFRSTHGDTCTNGILLFRLTYSRNLTCSCYIYSLKLNLHTFRIEYIPVSKTNIHMHCTHFQAFTLYWNQGIPQIVSWGKNIFRILFWFNRTK